ncbi:beta-ketoacyl synthase N-terminal-like domain-containing protein [Streptomyces sp. Tue6028]|uniref:type I polyketide synthase n=1 Tax=Streptomyces sp. Tue6028 TaxID=2036037 RepID=UPI003D762930
MSPSRTEIRAVVAGRLRSWYALDPGEIADDRPLAELGLTSRDAVTLTALLGEVVGRRLPETLLGDTQTIDALVERLTRERPDGHGAPWHGPRADRDMDRAAVAVVGVGCRFPGGADTPDAYWRLLREGRDAVGALPDDRRDAGPHLAAAPRSDGSPHDGPPHEDAPHVGTPHEGPPHDCPPHVGTPRVGTLHDGPPRVGTPHDGPPHEGPPDDGSPHVGTPHDGTPHDGTPHEGPPYGGFLDDMAGFDADFFRIGADEAAAMDPQHRVLLEVAREALDHAALPVTRLAGSRTGVFVGISGSEYAQVTAGAPDAWTTAGTAPGVAAARLSHALDLRGPSLAVDTACSSALVAVHHAVRSLATGESDTALAAGVSLLLAPRAPHRAGALVPDGRGGAFDAGADGTVRGEGCGVVVLKRLADAERDGDRVLAVVRSTAVNSDGRTGGPAAPNADARRALLAEAHTDPADVDYVETHGVGTPQGDPAEACALAAALASARTPDRPLLVGSARANLGHLRAAAGIAGLIKTVLALQHGEIPPHPHVTPAGTGGGLEALGLRVVTSAEPWPRHSGTATAGVSAFGFSGTNAHVVLTEHRARPRPEGPRTGPALLLLDAPSAERVRAYAGELADWLRAGPGVRDADLARTLAGRTGRGHHRAAVVTRGRAATVEALGRLAGGERSPHVVTGAADPRDGAGTVWIFPGEGCPWPGAGHELLETEPAFADAVERLEPLLRWHAGISLAEGLGADADLSSPAVAMPVLYGLQLGLAALWRSFGLEPAAVIGHAAGEVAAAVVSGAVDPVTGARIVAARARLRAGPRSDGPTPTSGRPTGGTSGTSEPRLACMEGEFARQLGELPAAAPGCARYSASLADSRDARYDTAHWEANLTGPARLPAALRAAAEDGHRVFVEVTPDTAGPQPPAGTLVVPTLRENTDDALAFGTALATLLVNGVRVPDLRERLAGRIEDVPPPRWRHRRHWFGEQASAASGRDPVLAAPDGEHRPSA